MLCLYIKLDIWGGIPTRNIWGPPNFVTNCHKNTQWISLYLEGSNGFVLFLDDNGLAFRICHEGTT